MHDPVVVILATIYLPLVEFGKMLLDLLFSGVNCQLFGQGHDGSFIHVRTSVMLLQETCRCSTSQSCDDLLFRASLQTDDMGEELLPAVRDIAYNSENAPQGNMIWRATRFTIE